MIVYSMPGRGRRLIGPCPGFPVVRLAVHRINSFAIFNETLMCPCPRGDRLLPHLRLRHMARGDADARMPATPVKKGCDASDGRYLVVAVDVHLLESSVP